MVLSPPVRIFFAAVLTCVCVSLPCAAATVLVVFSSPTCAPCQQMRPVVERLAGDGFQVREVDISRDPQTASRFGVTQVPTFLVMVEGQVVDQQIGATTYQQLREMLLKATPPPAPRRRAAPLGQSPQIPNTFAASSPAAVSPVVGGSDTRAPVVDLAQSQATRPSTVANPFAKTLSKQPVTSSSPAHQRLIASTVKISVEDPEGKSAGTGTIVDSRSGEALILTCGHLFRTSEGKGSITVTTFQPGPQGAIAGASYAGQLIDFDLERDLALISMRPTAPVPAVKIASPTASALPPGSTVTSVGCDHGDNPTAIDSRVTANNRYEGPANVEVAGAPVEGRSGGGLFNAQGELVGVCFAADHESNEGLYAALPSIYKKLDSLNLKMIYEPNAVSPAQPQMARPPAARSPLAAAPLPQSIRGQEPEAPSFTPSAPVATAALSAAEQAALEEIQRRGANSEVICIIRPKDPGGKSEVITLNNVSPGFIRALTQSPASVSGPSPATAAAGQLLR